MRSLLLVHSLVGGLIAFVVPAGATAQTFDHLALVIEGDISVVNGGERQSVGSGGGPLVLGKTQNAGISFTGDFCGLGAASTLRPDAVAGWTASVTPETVRDDAVTFRLRWTRSRDGGRDTTSPSGDEEMTLRPGQVALIDVIPVNAGTPKAYACGMRSAQLRVRVMYWPRAQDDPRLASSEMWLVERRADGTERSQALSVRGRFNQATSFFFEPLTEGATALEFYGEVTTVLKPAGWTIALVVRSRVTERGESSIILRDGQMMRARSVTETLTYAPGDIVEVELPRLSENTTGAFASSRFSIRLRSRQIR